MADRDDFNHFHQPATVQLFNAKDGSIEPDFPAGGGGVGYCTKHCLQADLVGPDKHEIRCNYMRCYVTNRKRIVCEPWVREVLLPKVEDRL